MNRVLLADSVAASSKALYEIFEYKIYNRLASHWSGLEVFRDIFESLGPF